MYFGWRRADGGYRFNRISLWIPKKNGKSWLISVLVGYKTFELKLARIYSAACNATQAKIVMSELIRLCKKSPKLKKLMDRGIIKAFCSPFRRDFTNNKTGSVYVALADNVNANDGIIPDVLVIDEIHRMKNKQVDVIDGSTSNNPNATKVVLSTAGDGDKTHRSWQEYAYAKKVISGEVIDTQTLAVIYECPDADKLKGEEIYDLDRLVACNPVLQEVPEKRAQAAKEMAIAREKRQDMYWRRFRLNQWVSVDGDEYIDQKTYNACEVKPEDVNLDGAECYVGFDCSGDAWDFRSLTFMFPLDDGRVFERHYAFAAKDRIEAMSEKDDIDYSRYISAGELIEIPPEAVADEWLRDWTKVEFAKYKVMQIAADPYAAKYLMESWTAAGIETVAVQQSNNALLSPVIDDYERRMSQGRIVHAPNNLFAWQLSCARRLTIAKDRWKIVKAMSDKTGKGGTGHIDSVDSALNALAALRVAEIERDAYAGSGGAVTG
jgi:phage terminase large subunit-like protein